jgi:hypothetical protein
MPFRKLLLRRFNLPARCVHNGPPPKRLGHGGNVQLHRTGGRTTDNQWYTGGRGRLIASFATYERYLAHRKGVSAEASIILRSFT